MMSGIFSDGQQLNWRLSHCPSLAFLALLVLWILAILAVLLLLREPAKYILFVRLAVFILPAVLLLVGYFIRWRSFNFHKEELSRRIFMNTVRTNAQLYASRRPFIVSTFHFKKDDSYQVFLMYYNPEECIEYIRQILLRVRPVEHRKLASLLAVYTLDSDYLRGHRLEERIAVMMCGAYGLELATKKLPAPIEQRHTRKRQCLCQFVEEFLAAYLPMLQHSESFTVQHIRTVFLRYLNCTIFPDQVVVETLGLVCPSDLEAEELATEGQRRRPGTSRNVKAEDPAVIVPMSQEQEETV